MNQLLAEYWYLLAIALVIGLVVAWYLFRSTRRTKVTGASRGDVLDEGAQKAQRNSALVDAPPAAARDPQPVATPTGLAGSGAAVAVSAEVGQVGVSSARSLPRVSTNWASPPSPRSRPGTRPISTGSTPNSGASRAVSGATTGSVRQAFWRQAILPNSRTATEPAPRKAGISGTPLCSDHYITLGRSKTRRLNGTVEAVTRAGRGR